MFLTSRYKIGRIKNVDCTKFSCKTHAYNVTYKIKENKALVTKEMYRHAYRWWWKKGVKKGGKRSRDGVLGTEKLIEIHG